MSFKFGFYNAIDHDRLYSAEDFGQMFDGLITDGIYSSIGGSFAVVAGSGLSVLVRPGRAWFNHTWSVNTADYPVQLDYSDLLLPRIDAIVIEVDTRAVVRANSIKKITGTPATNPVKPTLTKSDGLYQYPLAYVRVPQNAENVEAINIENCIGNVTPFVTGILKSVSIEELWNQWQAQFDTWFDGVKTALSGDIATNLLNRIVAVEDRATGLEKNKVNISDKATSAEAQSGTNDTKWMTPLKVQNHFDNRVATSTEVANGTDVKHYVTPKQLKDKTSITKSVVVKITTGTSWTVPSEAIGKPLTVMLVGGGGGGGGGCINDNRCGGGGGGGGCVAIIHNYIASSSYISCRVGAGGKGGSPGVKGGDGGNTVFGPFSINGGEGGKSKTQNDSNYGSGDGGGGGYISSKSNIDFNSGIVTIVTPYLKGGTTDINRVIEPEYFSKVPLSGKGIETSGGAALTYQNTGGRGGGGVDGAGGLGATGDNQDSLTGSNGNGYGSGGGGGGVDYNNHRGNGGNGAPGVIIIQYIA